MSRKKELIRDITAWSLIAGGIALERLSLDYSSPVGAVDVPVNVLTPVFDLYTSYAEITALSLSVAGVLLLLSPVIAAGYRTWRADAKIRRRKR